MLDPVVQSYLSFRSPLNSMRGSITLGVIIAILLFLGYLGWHSILGARSIFEVLDWVPFSITFSIIGYIIIAFLDRERRIRSFHFLIILFVMLVTAPAAGFFNTISQHPLQTVGFVEEGMKLIPVLLLAIFIPNLIRTRKDGIVYGALAGMGFNIIEIGLYIANALKDHTWVEAVITHSTRLGVWGFGSHIIWAAFTGMAVGLAAESMKTGWSKWRIVLFVYLVIALAHSAFDSGALGLALLATAFILAVTKYGMDALNNIDIKSGTTQPGILLDAMRYLHYVYNIIFIIVLFIQTRKSFRLENALQVKELSNEKPSIVSRDELVLLKNEEFFFKRKYRDYPKKVGDKIVLYQNLLAMQKHTARQFDIPLEDAYTISQLRKAIINLKSTSI